MTFAGSLRVEFGDFGTEYGRYAWTLASITWQSGDVLVVIPEGTITDGASVPRILWWFLPPWGDEATLPAVLHDFICERMDKGNPVLGCETRVRCDWQFYLALRARGVTAWRALIVWLGVRGNSIVERRP